MADESVKIGRLALRHEGKFWNAYYAMPGTMDQAILLGSISMSAVRERDARRVAFMALMRDVVSDMVEDACGERPTWSGAEQAPESERAGHA